MPVLNSAAWNPAAGTLTLSYDVQIFRGAGGDLNANGLTWFDTDGNAASIPTSGSLVTSSAGSIGSQAITITYNGSAITDIEALRVSGATDARTISLTAGFAIDIGMIDPSLAVTNFDIETEARLIDAFWDSANGILELTFNEFVTKSGGNTTNVTWFDGTTDANIGMDLSPFATDPSYAIHLIPGSDIFIIKYDLVRAAAIEALGDPRVSIPEGWGNAADNLAETVAETRFRVARGVNQPLTTVGVPAYVELDVTNTNRVSAIIFNGLSVPADSTMKAIFPLTSTSGGSTIASSGHVVFKQITKEALATGNVTSSSIVVGTTARLVK